ncbi:MAG TPA: DUF3761 domain-containing protein [Trinickia sp.]|jgi:hypothetical protein|uniref:DUF3761 domain-containing protein n=1 Tax=Trinickia sp. TaxID=2571163 RepID=UPI002BD18AE4|nr:DUF3761 domain-containing protein [Trinickia sp.]HVW53108.1 DUF3761 domain-containing protein [Trinickia sp.]
MNHTVSRFTRTIASAVIAWVALASPPSYARSSASEQWSQPDEANLTSHGHYRNKSGQDVHSPAKTMNGSVPAGASAKCADGTYSFSRHHSGTCSRHGGVAQWE